MSPTKQSKQSTQIHLRIVLVLVHVPYYECRIVWPGLFGHGHFGQDFRLGGQFGQTREYL